MAEKEKTPRLELVYPVYLDVPMMISFLAALQGGVSFEDESVRRSLTGGESAREGSGKVGLGLPALGSLLGFDMSGRMSKSGREEETEEVKAVRQHTSASLFNALYQLLNGAGYVETIAGRADLEGLEVGQLIEVTGAFVGNPLKKILDVLAQVMPYMDMEEKIKEELAGGGKPKNPRKSGHPAVRAQADELETARQIAEAANKAEQLQQRFGLELMKQMKVDLDQAQVHDTVIEAAGDLRIVLTMSSEFFDEPTAEYLRAGNFTAIGKVTRVLAEGEEINLTRRTVMGAAGSETAREIIGSVGNAEAFAIDAGDPVITSPAIQVLPLAVFI